MPTKVSPLAPKLYPELPEITGVKLASVEAGIKYTGRKDLCLIVFDELAEVAGVLTRSHCPSAAVDWCRKQLSKGKAKCVVINSGNANAFTGMKGRESVGLTAEAAGNVVGCDPRRVLIASTGVIGEPLDVSEFPVRLEMANAVLNQDGWHEAAQAIMTTDTYPKLATRSFNIDGQDYIINGIAKGSGMIAPDMATMLAFVITDFPVSHKVLQKLLNRHVKNTFNSITVDSDTSTSDTLLVFSTGGRNKISKLDTKRAKPFESALSQVLHELAMLIVRDGEGASKHVCIEVTGAASKSSARKIAKSVANSPLVKTAIAGEDANWGRIVMAVGKAGEPADRDRLCIKFGGVVCAEDGMRAASYDEAEMSAIMRRQEIDISIDVGIGKASAKVWTCDLTREYIAINADYRS